MWWPLGMGGGEVPRASREREGIGNEDTLIEQPWLERRQFSGCLISHGGKGHVMLFSHPSPQSCESRDLP